MRYDHKAETTMKANILGEEKSMLSMRESKKR